MRPLDCLATVGVWSLFGATVLLFDPPLRLASWWGGVEAMDKVMPHLARALQWTFPLGFCRLNVEGQENIPDHGGVIVVGNHQSLVESFMPFYLLRRLRPKYVAKELLGRCYLPSISFALRRGGHCLINRRDRAQALEAIARLGEEVTKGEISAVIFPEGTRSDQGELQSFKLGGLATLLAKAPQAPILPMLVHNGHQIYPKGLPRVRAGSTVTMRFLPLLERAGMEDQELLAKLQTLMIDNYRQLEGC